MNAFGSNFRMVLLGLILLPLRASCAVVFEATEVNAEAEVDAPSIKAQFKFTNTGSSELMILTVEGECGCTSAKADRVRYGPGEKGVIAVTYTPTARDHGVQLKKITVTTDDATEPVVRLALKTELRSYVTWGPTALVWSESGLDKVVTFQGDLGKIVQVVHVASLRGKARASIVKSDSQFEVKVTPLAEGAFEDTLMVRLLIEGVGEKTYQIPVLRQ